MSTQPDDTETDLDPFATTTERSDLAADAMAPPTQPAERTTHEPAGVPTQPLAPPQPDTAQRATPVEEPRTDALFGSDDLTGLRTRWDDVQAGFVDDPRKCVQSADGLVSDVVEQLTDGFSQARAKLEGQWSRGEDVSTEDLRLALKRYREFFDRLLAV